MTCGPWATELGALLLGLKFRKLLKLDAWCLVLGASGLQLVACSFSPVTVLHGPRFMDLVYFSVGHMSRFGCLETSSFDSSGTCRPDLGLGRSCSLLRL